jgi:hypothetical protein
MGLPSRKLFASSVIPHYSFGMRSSFVMAVFSLLSLSCAGRTNGDPPSDAGASTTGLGFGVRLRDVQTPEASPVDGLAVRIAGAKILHVDRFDETRDGKSAGTVYIQDEDAEARMGDLRGFSGIAIYQPKYVPADLRPQPGDVFDFAGKLSINPGPPGTTDPSKFFPDGQVTRQLFQPVSVLRYDGPPAKPIEIDVNELMEYNTTGQRWMGMLVTVKNIRIVSSPRDSRGRLTAIIAGQDPMDQQAPVISNELYDIKPGDIAQGKTFASLTGIVTYFFNLKIAPRSAADLVAN